MDQLNHIRATRRKEFEKRAIITSMLVIILLTGFIPLAKAQSGPPIPDAIWVDGTLFGVVLTPNSLPPHGPKDGVYNFVNSGLSGQRSFGEAKPGDKDYNGGRWVVTFVGYTAAGRTFYDPDGDGVVNTEMTSWEDVQQAINMGYLTVTGEGPSFTCPLKPQRGHQR